VLVYGAFMTVEDISFKFHFIHKPRQRLISDIYETSAEEDVFFSCSLQMFDTTELMEFCV